MNPTFDFNIQSTQEISRIFRTNNLDTFSQAALFVKNLPYGRNLDKSSITCIFDENKGTCSTKHAVLHQLAIENGYHNVHLILGIFLMNGKNSPKTRKTLEKHGLIQIPEAHCYLKIDGQILDCTTSKSSERDFLNDLIFETEIETHEANAEKVLIHKAYLQKWLIENPEISLTIAEIWKIREECIQNLSED